MLEKKMTENYSPLRRNIFHYIGFRKTALFVEKLLNENRRKKIVIKSLTPPPPGFIDFIVMPTLTVLGDVMDSLFSCLDIPASRLHNNNNIPENAVLDSKKSMLHRPWNDILVENRSKWQAKHDAGEPEA
jgi:hypothetical protein